MKASSFKTCFRKPTVSLRLVAGLWGCVAAWPASSGAQDLAGELQAARGALSKNETHRAIGILETALKQLPTADGEHTPLRVLLAQAYLRDGRSERVTELLRGLEQHPEAVLCLAQVALQKERWNAAAAQFAEARTLGADPVACVLGRAQALPQLERSAEAEVELRSLEANALGGNAVRLALCGVLLERRATEEARAVLERVTQPEA
ncbi:MAG: hypothetical protein WCK17_03850, partial [Verrucomicrobiota bacterium]